MSTTAKIFTHGRRQAVRLPKEFRLPGTEVRVSQVGNKVILEPLEPPPFDVQAWRNRLDQYLDVPFPEPPEEPPVDANDTPTFD